jgi:hypothetical protein
MRVIIAGLGIFCLLATIQIVNAQMELSCTASQEVAIQARLRDLPPQLPPAAQQLFQAAATQLQQERTQLFTEALAVEKQYTEIVAKGRDEVLKANPGLVQKAVQQVQDEHPDLVRQSDSGDQQARRQLEGFVWNSLSKDATFGSLLQNRLIQDPQYDGSAAKMLDVQQRLNKTEGRQDKLQLSLPTLDREQRMAEAGQRIAGEQHISDRAVADSPAFRDLLVTAYYASKLGSVGGELEPKARFAMQKFDNPVGQADLGNQFAEFTQASETGRRAMREVQAAKLEVDLGFGHLPTFLPTAPQRSSALRSEQSQLSRSIARTTGELLNKKLNTDLSTQLLDRIKVPPPSPGPDSSAPSDRLKELAGNLKRTGQKIVIIMMGEDK